MYVLNFIAFVFCTIAAILQGYCGNVGKCLLEIALALLNLPYSIIWLKEIFDFKNDVKIGYCELSQNETSEEIWSWNETYSDDWYHGTFSSKEEAIEDAICTQKFYDKKLDKIKIGKCEYIPLRTDVDPDRVMEDLDELYCDETGCEDYIYEGVTDEQRQWLEDKLSDVMVEFHKMIGLSSCWFRVVEEETIDLVDYEKEK